MDDLEYDGDFLDITLKAQPMKEIIDKLDLIKIKNFCYEKDKVKRIIRQDTYQDKIFTENMSDKRILPQIYKKFLNLNNKKTTQLKDGSKN